MIISQIDKLRRKKIHDRRNGKRKIWFGGSDEAVSFQQILSDDLCGIYSPAGLWGYAEYGHLLYDLCSAK